MANDISLNQDHQDGVLSLKAIQGPQYPQEHLDDLSSKYDLAMGSASPGAISIQSSISSNNQGRLNELLTMQKGLELENARNGIIQSIANKAGGVVTPEVVGAVRALSSQDLSSGDYSAALEQEYSKQVTNTQLQAVNDKTNGGYDQAIVSDPTGTNNLLDRAEFQTSRNMIANNIYQELKKKYDDSGLIQKGLAWGQVFIPFRSWAALGNTGQSGLQSSILPGDSLEAQHAYLNTLPPAEYKQKFQARVDELVSQGDYLDAMTFAESALAYSDNDKFWQNIMAAGDVASIVPFGGIVKALKGSSQAVNIAVRDVEALAKAAKLEDNAVRISATEALTAGKLPLSNITKGPDVEKAVASIMRPAEAFAGRETSAGGIPLARIQTAMETRASNAFQIISGINKVERLAPGEIEAVVQKAIDDSKKMFVDQSSNLRNIRHNVADNETNVHTVTAIFGKKDGGYFPDEKGAKAWAKRVLGSKTNDAVAVNNGTGWTVEVTRNVDETKAGIRDFSIETSSKNADNFWTRLIPFLMGADTKLSPEQQIARSVATMSAEQNQALLVEFGRPIATLQADKKGFKEFDKFLKTGRDRVDPERGRGVTYHTLQEFEDAWYTQFNKTPTEAQTDAYFAYKQAYDTDWVVRALDVYKQKSILGIEKFTAKHLVDGKLAEPVSFEGKVVDQLPFGAPDNWRVAFLDEEGTLMSGVKNDSRFMTLADQEAIKARIAEGNYTIVQAYHGVHGIDDKYFNFIAMKNFQRDRVALDLNYKNGTRVVQKYPWFIKQGKFSIEGGNARYLGDTAIANARDAEDGKIILDKMEQARKLLKAEKGMGNKFRKEYPAKTFFEQNFPMWDYADFAKSIDTDVPFSLTRSGARTIDTEDMLAKLKGEGHAINGMETGNPWRLSNQVKGRFLGDAEKTNMATWGVEKDSIFELAQDSVLSPLETLKMSMGDMVDINTMNDYKIKSIRDFTQQFGHLLEGTSADFSQNGLKYISQPLYRKGITDAERKGAEAVRHAILSLWQHSTSVDRAIGTYKEKLVKTLRNSLGDTVADFASDKALPFIQNTDGHMRWFAFHTKMGFWNPKQLFLQASTVANITSISPKYGAKAAMLMTPIMAGLKAPSEQVLKGMGVKLAGTMGIKPEDYIELIDMYKRSGFSLVSGDVAYLDDLAPPKLLQGKVGQVLNTDTAFFQMGERTARTAAFATAYLERKAAGKALTRADEGWILKRAKDLTGNMTRDSNAPYQRGYTSVVTQFFGYQMRLMEQMLGTKLTLAEKARLGVGMSLLYGVPVGAGMTFGVAPVRDWVKYTLNRNGMKTDNTLAEPFIDGFASDLLKMITGSKFDIAGRYGPNGLTNFSDLMTGDVSLFNLLLGASGGIIVNTAMDFDPIIRGVLSSMNPWDTDKFQTTPQDWLQPLSEITTANSVIKYWKAKNTGEWMSKNENKMSDISPLEAAISAIFGIEKQSVSDAFSQIDVMNDIKDQQAKDEKAMIADYRRGVQALRAQDKELAQTYFKRVKARGHSSGFTATQFNRMYRRAIQDEPLDESVLKQFTKFYDEVN